MVEVYAIQARLNMASNVPEVITRLLRSFSDLEKIIAQTQEKLNKFTSILGGKALEDVEKIASASRKMAEGQEQAAKAAKQTVESYERLVKLGNEVKAPGSGKAGGGGPGGGRPGGGGGGEKGIPMQGHGSYADAAMALQMSGGPAVSFFEQSIEAAAQVEHLLNILRMSTKIDPPTIAKAKELAEKMVRDVPGTQVAENLGTILDAFTITADINEAMAAAPAMAKMNIVLKSLPGVKSDDPGYAAGQAIEVMQKFYDPKTHQIDMDAFNKQMASMVQVAVGTKGRVDPAMYLAFAKQARMGGMLADDQFMYRDLPAMLIALGGNRAGTGEAATFRQFGQGRMTQIASEEMKKVGALKPGAIWTHGRVLDMENNLIGFNTFAKNPVQWVRDFMLPGMAKSGVDINDREKLGMSAAKFSSTNVSLGFLAEMLLGMTGINKEAENIETHTTDPMSVLKEDPLQKIREFHAAENEFMVQLGSTLLGPAIDGLKALTGALQGLTDWAKNNPGAAKNIAEIGATMAIIASVLGNVGFWLIMASPLVKIAGSGLMLLARGVMAVTGIAGVVEAGTGLVALARGATAITGIAGLASAGTALAAIAAGIGAILGLGAVAGKQNAPMGDDYGRQVGTWGGKPSALPGRAYGGTPEDLYHHPGESIKEQFRPLAGIIVDGIKSLFTGTMNVNVVNGKDLANGVANHIADQTSRPLSGSSQPDLRQSPLMPGLPSGWLATQ